jgi:hypothetical protein
MLVGLLLLPLFLAMKPRWWRWTAAVAAAGVAAMDDDWRQKRPAMRALTLHDSVQ